MTVNSHLILMAFNAYYVGAVEVGAITHKYDHLYAEYGAPLGIPVAYLRALAKWESGSNPRKHTIWTVKDPETGKKKKLYGGRGLLQVVSVKDFNEHYGTNWKLSDMFDPGKNVRVALFTMSHILQAYRKHEDPNMRPDWSNPHFVELFTAGWNSGYSNKGGIGRVAYCMEAKGIPITLKTLASHKECWTSAIHRNFRNNRTLAWAPKVRRTYFQQLDSHPPLEGVEKVSGAGAAFVAAFLGLFAVLWGGKK